MAFRDAVLAGDIPLGPFSIGLPDLSGIGRPEINADYRRDVAALVEYLRQRGLQARPVSVEYLTGRDGNGLVYGRRQGNNVDYAATLDRYGLRPVSPEEMLETLAHEYVHFDGKRKRSERETQLLAIDFLTHEFPHKGARRKAIEVGLQEGLLTAEEAALLSRNQVI